MTSIASINLPEMIHSPYYSLEIMFASQSVTIEMILKTQFVNTKHLPLTAKIIGDLLPSIHKHRCFNFKNQAFAEELKQTQIGHLFEHIIMEYMYQYKMRNQFLKASYKGQTNWNWQEEQTGLFHISINVSSEDKFIFMDALQKSIHLLNRILNSIHET